MFDINSITLCGHVARDPRVHTFPDGSLSAVFSVGTNRSWLVNGERHEAVTFNQVSVVGYNADVASQFKKGERVLIVGSLETRSYEKNSVTIYVTEVAVRNAPGHACAWLEVPAREAPPPPPPPAARRGRTATSSRTKAAPVDLGPEPEDTIPF
jgi:single-strand DNA-binding protein